MSFVSNEDYLERWEAAAPTPVENTLTPEEIAQRQGTRLQKEETWKTYDKELADNFSPELEAAIAEYATRVEDTSDDHTKEDLARRQEENADVAAEYQWVKPEEYKDKGARIGKVIHSSDFIVKLRQIGLKCWYRFHPQPKKITLVYQATSSSLEVGCWVQLGFMPELSIMDFDTHGVPLAEKYRGWRTAVLQLILKGAITEEQAGATFGKPKTTEAFHRYNSTLQSFRNNGGRLG